MLTLFAPALAAQPLTFTDLLPELARRIAAIVPPGSQIRLSVAPSDGATGTIDELHATISALLSGRGFVLSETGTGIAVSVSCGESLRERSCLADVAAGASANVVAAFEPHGDRARDGGVAVMQLRPLLSQRRPILDIARSGDVLFVLEPFAVTRHELADDDWRPVDSTPVATSRVWPRDVRGRLIIERDRITALLPGVVCNGAVRPLSVVCAEAQQPWPIGLENTGLGANGNTFSTPEGLAFYSAASIDSTEWLIADRDGSLTLLDQYRRPLARVGSGSDVAGLRTSCAARSHVVASASGPGGDILRLFEVVDGRLVPTASRVPLPGVVTVLWAKSDSGFATVVARDDSAGRYEAFELHLSCDR